MHRKFASLAIAFFTLISCSSSKDASKDNFAAAILKRSDALRLCLSVPGPNHARKGYPAEYEAKNNPFNSSDIEIHNLLVKQGLESERIEQRPPSVVPFLEKPKLVDWKIFEPTAKGKAVLYRVKNMAGSDLQFCFGEISDLSIDNFTEPAEIMSQRATQVEFSYKISTVPEWVSENSQLLSQASSGRSTKVNERITARTTLVLTDNGWVDSSDLQRIKTTYELIQNDSELLSGNMRL
ncbi:MAG: hypothetical protein J5J00_10560 [Deltaproteobacteria bacterium]|nr:hypothetical protein [Deltaproteobacteria bacterium]